MEKIFLDFEVAVSRSALAEKTPRLDKAQKQIDAKIKAEKLKRAMAKQKR
jgi:hypothetical protein